MSAGREMLAARAVRRFTETQGGFSSRGFERIDCSASVERVHGTTPKRAAVHFAPLPETVDLYFGVNALT